MYNNSPRKHGAGGSPRSSPRKGLLGSLEHGLTDIERAPAGGKRRILYMLIFIPALLGLSFFLTSSLGSSLARWNVPAQLAGDPEVALAAAMRVQRQGQTPTTEEMKIARKMSAAVANAVVMQAEYETMEHFQDLVRVQQHAVDCKTAGLIVQKKTRRPQDGFAVEFQIFGRLLMAAMASGRTLVVSNAWSSAYEPPNCAWDVSSGGEELDVEKRHASSARGWNCMFEPLSWCEVDETTVTDHAHERREPPTPVGLPAGTPHAIGWNETKGDYLQLSTLFDLHFHGVKRIIAARDWTGNDEEFPQEWFEGRGQIDIVSGWERSHGRFWIRSQMAHALWRPSEGLAEEIKRRMPPTLGDVPYIGFHIRYSDNIDDFIGGFGRDATKTRDFSRFMANAETYRAEHPHLDLKTIYLATDSTKMLKASKDPKWRKRGWTFVSQKDVQRSTGTGRIWFAAGRKFGAAGIATDVECLRRADFLIGSFQSNVYRLATELNMAWMTGKYPISMPRHRTVDVEYYEDP